MINVDSNFYAKGLTIDGKGNRVMLKKDGETVIEMEFSRGGVKLTGMTGEKENHSILVGFNEICRITLDNENPSMPAIILY